MQRGSATAGTAQAAKDSGATVKVRTCMTSRQPPSRQSSHWPASPTGGFLDCGPGCLAPYNGILFQARSKQKLPLTSGWHRSEPEAHGYRFGILDHTYVTT